MDYDMDIHHNPDAQAWAKFFIETTEVMDRAAFRDEGYMIAWFSNAMMAMHDHLYKPEIAQLREALRLAGNKVEPLASFQQKDIGSSTIRVGEETKFSRDARSFNGEK